MKQLLAGPIGSFIKAFVVAILTTMTYEYQQGRTCLTWSCLMPMLVAAGYATLPVIINYLNPNYPGYGNAFKKDVAETEG